MPFFLEEKECSSALEKFKSVLIIPCRFCPAASLSVIKKQPYIELFSHFLKTESYEQYIKTIEFDLNKKGIKTGVFKSHLIHQFIICGWTSNRRNQLMNYANEYEAFFVLGCDGAAQSVQDAVKSSACKVINGMETIGIMSMKPTFALPCSISLELDSVSPVIFAENDIKSEKKVEVGSSVY